MKVSLIIPAKNEEQNIISILNKIPDFISEIIVIDGNSSDKTFQLANNYSPKVKVYKQRTSGKGAALSLGFNLASGDFLVALDADGSNDPQELQLFIEKFKEGYELIKGSRYIKQGGSEDLTIFRSFGNIFLTKIANFLFSTKWTDLAYGYVGITKNLASKLKILDFDLKRNIFGYGTGFEIESLICCRAAKNNSKIIEIPSFEKKRVYGSSNLKSIPDGSRALSAIIIEKFVNISQK